MNEPAVRIMELGLVIPALPGHSVVATVPGAAEPVLSVGPF
jgi:hypothetical protein